MGEKSLDQALKMDGREGRRWERGQTMSRAARSVY